MARQADWRALQAQADRHRYAARRLSGPARAEQERLAHRFETQAATERTLETQRIANEQAEAAERHSSQTRDRARWEEDQRARATDRIRDRIGEAARDTGDAWANHIEMHKQRNRDQ